MVIYKKQIKHIADLARIGFTAKELGKFQKEFADVLKFVGKLNEAKVEETQLTGQITGLKNVLREDKATAKTQAERNKLLDLAPETKDGLIKVRAVL